MTVRRPPPRHAAPSFVAVLLALALVAVAPRAFAGGQNDDAAEALIETSLKPGESYEGAAGGRSIAKLQLAKKLCEKQCSPKVRVRVRIALGTVYVLAKKESEARDEFAAALKEDPTATPPTELANADVKRVFEEAKGTPATAPEPTKPPPSLEGLKLKKQCKDDGKAPKGWRSAAAFCYFAEAVAAESAQSWAECVDYAQASRVFEDRPTSRFLGAQCRERGGKWSEALRDYQETIEVARQAGMTATAQEAQNRAQALREKIPRIVVRAPKDATELVVKIDGQPVPADKLGGEVWVDPGHHTVQATGKTSGVALKFEQVVDMAENDRKVVEITPGAAPGTALKDKRILECMSNARSREEAQKCLEKPKEASGLDVKVAAEFSAYQDSDAVSVATPGVYAVIESPTGGWGANGSLLVDVVTAASADIVANASPRWTEIRYVPALGAHKKLGDADIGLKAAASVEPDYLALTAGARFAVDLSQKTVTPSLGYTYMHEISGRSGTPFSVFSHPINKHALDVAITFVMDKATILSLTTSGMGEFGDQTKPYRYLPVFDKATQILAGETVASVNAKRLPPRLAEHYPNSRYRLGVSGLYAHRFTSVTFRLEERLYTDNWGLKATTTDFLLPFDLTSSLRMWPHLRYHAQTSVDFWELAYRAERTAAGLKIPILRTGDREMGPLMTGTGGLGARLDLGESKRWGIQLAADAMYTRFLDHLFVRGRFGVFGALTLETEFE